MNGRKETLGAICFLVGMGLCFAVLAASFVLGGSLRQAFGTSRREGGFSAFTETAETAANTDLDRTHMFIQVYGGYQRLLGRRVVEDPVESYTVVKLDDGALTFIPVSTEEDAAKNAADVIELRDTLAEAGIPYLFTMAPHKIRDPAQMPVGIPNQTAACADRFLALLAESGVDALDLRPWFERHGEYGDWFFRTDHHWKPEAGLAAYGVLAEELTERYGFSFDPALAEESNYSKTVYEDWFLGSQGKRVGSLYAGVDDFTVYTPNFDTDLTYSCPLYGMERNGPFEVSVCFPERLAERDWFNENPYVYYAGGDYPLARAVNHNNPDGPKILLIRESFACAITPFLALGCSELVTVDLRHLPDDLMEVILEEQPDLVMTLYCASSIA